jgi:hypothetical protein
MKTGRTSSRPREAHQTSRQGTECSAGAHFFRIYLLPSKHYTNTPFEALEALSVEKRGRIHRLLPSSLSPRLLVLEFIGCFSPIHQSLTHNHPSKLSKPFLEFISWLLEALEAPWRCLMLLESLHEDTCRIFPLNPFLEFISTALSLDFFTYTKTPSYTKIPSQLSKLSKTSSLRHHGRTLFHCSEPILHIIDFTWRSLPLLDASIVTRILCSFLLLA